MDDYNPNELIAVCDSILEDGEISGEELYRLAEWLNGNQEACHHWPGNLLVAPLQEVWADGRVTKTEMRQIGRLLIQIRKAWAKRQTEAALQSAFDNAARIASALNLSQPRMPSIPYVTRVRSQTDSSMFYEVDLSEPRCSCPDWQSKRYALPQAHLSRCCKHVFTAFGQLEPESGWPGWLGAFVNLSWPPHPSQQWMVIRTGRGLVLASTAPAGWANVFAPENGTYDRFGYNVTEDRWSYGTEPTDSERIARAIIQAGGR